MRRGNNTKLFVGIDVQIRRGIPCCVMDSGGTVVESVWLDVPTATRDLQRLLDNLGAERCFVGIDAPRVPLPRLRTWSFAKNGWVKTAGKNGRHCELVIRRLNLANPQWTPLADDAPAWMKLGFSLFRAADETGAATEEVFPTASYRALELAGSEGTVSISLDVMRPGPKDMLDAVVGAFTVLRYCEGRGSAVGGGDNLGTIILPTAVGDHPVQLWPAAN